MRMQRTDAAELIAILKGLMPMLTDEQARVAFESVMQRDDIDLCRNAIKAYACDFEQFSLATFIDRLPPRPGDNAPAWDRIEFERVKAERDAIQNQQDADSELCDAMPDETFEKLARDHISRFDPEVQTLRCYSAGRSVEQLRKSKYLTSLVAAHARAHGIGAGGLFQEAQ